MNEWERCIDEWAERLSVSRKETADAQATIADLQGQVQTAQAKLVDYETKTYCAFCGQTYLIDTGAELIARHIKECSKHPMRDVEQRVAQLEGALERVANVPVDGDGRDYYWEGRDIAKQAIGKPTSERYTSLQADHATLMGQLTKWEEIASLRFAGDHKFVKEMELLKVENNALQQRVAQLEGQLSTPTWVCDGCGRVSREGWITIVNETLDGIDYDMECPSCGVREIEEDSAADLVRELERLEDQLTTLQADHAALLGLVQAFRKINGTVTKLDVETQVILDAQPFIDLLTYRASLPAQPAQGGAKCVWIDDGGGTYATGCKEYFQVYAESEEAPQWIKFCCYCGKPVEHFEDADVERETRA